jgi:predicted class III extradiol MEMO1 family dioxygenase
MYSTVFKHILTCVSCIRFHYTRYDKKCGPIHKSIEALDKMGMDIIETGNADALKQYRSEYGNTICGRHPISVFLHVSAQISEVT